MTSQPSNPQAPGDAKMPARKALNPRVPFDLVAVDIDGTLLRGDKRLSMKVVSAVKSIRTLGVKVVLATARPPRSVREIYGLLGLDTLQINYNGALITNPQTSERLKHWNLDPALALEIIRFARKAFPKIVVNVENLDKGYTDRVDDKLTTETSKMFAPDSVGPIESFLKEPVTKVMFMAQESQMEILRKQIYAKFGKLVCFPASDPHLLQMMNKDADKGVALQWVASYYNIQPERVMAIGDAPNDIGMIKWAGLGVAVGSGWDETREAADIVVPGNDEDGVAFALKRYILENMTPTITPKNPARPTGGDGPSGGTAGGSKSSDGSAGVHVGSKSNAGAMGGQANVKPTSSPTGSPSSVKGTPGDSKKT